MSRWWPFGKKHKKEAEGAKSEFQLQLQEALLSKDDLNAAVASMKKERMDRLARTQTGMMRPKLDSRPATS